MQRVKEPALSLSCLRLPDIAGVRCRVSSAELPVVEGFEDSKCPNVYGDSYIIRLPEQNLQVAYQDLPAIFKEL